MSIQKEFILRYRDDGHIRFQVPARICSIDAAKAIIAGISGINGVYRINLYRSQGKLSIRFKESTCDFKSLARQLFDLITKLEQTGCLQAPPVSKTARWKEKTIAKFEAVKAARWVKEKFGDAKETMQAAKVISKLGMKDPEKAIIDFLNDMLVLFLIKLHWKEITLLWLAKPFKYRYEWMALFYMFFLLVRSRRPK